VLTLSRIVHLVKVAVWSVFLAAFPPLAFANGMYAATIVLSAMGLLLALTELRGLLPESTPPKIQRAVVAGAVLLHVALLVGAVVRLVVPKYGAWERVPGTDGWNNSSLVRAERGALFAVGSGAVYSLRDDGSFAALPEIEGPVYALGAGARRAWFVDVEGKAAWGHDGASLVTIPLRWGVIPRRPVGAALDDAIFLVHGGALVRVEREAPARMVIDGGAITGVATDGERVVAVGKHLFVSEDGGLHFEDRGALDLPAPSVYAGGGSYYVVQGGVVSSQLFVSESGKALEERSAPVRDVRAIVVDPRDGRRAWFASFGEGIWQTEDGGMNYRDLELEGLEVRALCVDFARGQAGAGWVAASNLAIPSGIFHYVGP